MPRWRSKPTSRRGGLPRGCSQSLHPMSRSASARNKLCPIEASALAKKSAKNLFQDIHRANLQKAQPLAARMRPRTVEEFVGQEHFFGPEKLLRRMLQADRLSSLIFYGPPGT